MTFAIKTIPEPAARNEQISPVWGEITLGDFIESFPLLTTAWSAADYERQWREAVAALVHGRVDRAMLVVDIQPTSDSDAIMCFMLYREGSRVLVHERFMRPAPRLDVRVPETIEPIIPPRIPDREDESGEVSEWCVSIDDLREFLAAAPIRPPSNH